MYLGVSLGSQEEGVGYSLGIPLCQPSGVRGGLGLGLGMTEQGIKVMYNRTSAITM